MNYMCIPQVHMVASSETWYRSRLYLTFLVTGLCFLVVEHRQHLLLPSHGINGSKFQYKLARRNQSAEVRHKNALPTLVDAYRTLWTAGWNARYTEYFLDVPPKITWTPEAEDIVAREYRRLHFPADCSEVRGWLIVNTYNWGVMSVLRDYQSDVLRALAMNYTLVHQGVYDLCPSDSQRYLDCFWEDLNGCQPEFSALSNIPRIHQPQEVTTSPVTQDQFPHWLWDALVNAGTVHMQHGLTNAYLTEKDIVDKDQYLQLKLSVLRAILCKTVFKPREHIQKKTLGIVESWRLNGSYTNASETGLVIHIRRTDKMIDLGPHWRYIDFKSTAHLGLLIKTMENIISSTFQHFFVMSDDPDMQKRGIKELAPFFQADPSTLVSTELCDLLGANHLEYSGHESLKAAHRHELYDIVIAEMYAAIEVSQYVIGSGSCAVSQFMALNIGARHRVEPGLLALWEEDIIVKECRWILDQRLRLHENCPVSSYSDHEDLAMRFVTRDFLNKVWSDKGCIHFTPRLPECLGDAPA